MLSFHSTASVAIVASVASLSGCNAAPVSTEEAEVAAMSGEDIATSEGHALVAVQSACVPESNATFCARMSATCGAKSGTDNCGNARSVASCGRCSAPKSCTGYNTCSESPIWTTNNQKLVLADYMPTHTTRVAGGSLGLWRYDGNAAASTASVTRRVSNGDLIGQDGRNSIASMVYPATGPQSEEDEDYLEYQVLQAKAANIDGFMVEWNGPDKAIALKLRDVAARFDFRVGAVWQGDQSLRNAVAAGTLPSQPTASDVTDFAKSTVTRLRGELYDRATTPMVNGRPLVMFFAFGAPAYNDLPALKRAWGTGAQPLFARTLLALPHAYAAGNLNAGIGKVDGFYPWSTPARALSETTSTEPELASMIADRTHDRFFGTDSMAAYRERWIGYSRMHQNAGLPLRMGGVMGSMDNRACGGWGSELNTLSRNGGETMRRQWELYARERENLDVVLVATWNDWTEGTAVEASVERGLEDVTLIEQGAAAFKGTPSDVAGLPLPKRLFDLRKGYAALVRLGYEGTAHASALSSIAQSIATRDFEGAANALGKEEALLASLQARVYVPASGGTTTQQVLAADATRTATASVPAYLNVSAAIDTAVSSRHADVELTWEWLDTTNATHTVVTNAFGVAKSDIVAQVTGTSTGSWKSARVRVREENCAFARDGVTGNAVLKFVGDVTIRNVSITAVRKELTSTQP